MAGGGDADANGALQGTAAGKYAVGDVAEADGDKAATVGDSVRIDRTSSSSSSSSS